MASFFFSGLQGCEEKMSENLKKSPVERLRDQLTKRAKSISDSELVKGWPDLVPGAVANGIPPLIDLFRDLGSENPELRQFAEDTLEKRARECGLASVDQLRTVVVNLREKLKGELSEDDWTVYFRSSADFI